MGESCGIGTGDIRRKQAKNPVVISGFREAFQAIKNVQQSMKAIKRWVKTVRNVSKQLGKIIIELIDKRFLKVNDNQQVKVTKFGEWVVEEKLSVQWLLSNRRFSFNEATSYYTNEISDKEKEQLGKARTQAIVETNGGDDNDKDQENDEEIDQ